MEIVIATCDNCDSVSELTRVHIPTGKRGRPPLKFYCGDCLESEKGKYILPGTKSVKVDGIITRVVRDLNGFDGACLFLLDLLYENLFEPIGRGYQDYRCKGCSSEVKRPDRKSHFIDHKITLVGN